MQKFVLMVGLGLSFMVGPLSTQADPAVPAPSEAAKTVDTGPREWRTIKLRYGKPSMMAWWLDPAHHPEPAELVEGRKLVESVGGNSLPAATPPKQPAKQRAVFDLPPGVDEIKADDAHYVLSVLATQKGLEDLQRIVAFLDKPVSAVSINAVLIESDDESIAPLAGNAARQTDSVISYLGKNAQAKLNELVEGGKARIVADYQFSTKNNVPNGDTALLAMPDSETKAEPSREFSMKLVVTPTINLDNTISNVMHMSATNRGHDAELTQPASYDSLNTIVNTRNGDAVLLRGFRIGPWGLDVAEPLQKKNIYLLLKTQILEGKRFQ